MEPQINVSLSQINKQTNKQASESQLPHQENEDDKTGGSPMGQHHQPAQRSTRLCPVLREGQLSLR